MFEKVYKNCAFEDFIARILLLSSKLTCRWLDLGSLNFFDNLSHLLSRDPFFDQTYNNCQWVFIQITVEVVTQLINVLKRLSAFVLLDVLFAMVSVHLVGGLIWFFKFLCLISNSYLVFDCIQFNLLQNEQIKNKKNSKTLHPGRSGPDSCMEQITPKSVGIFFVFSIKLLPLFLFDGSSLLLNFTANIGILNKFFLFQSLLFLYLG